MNGVWVDASLQFLTKSCLSLVIIRLYKETFYQEVYLKKFVTFLIKVFYYKLLYNSDEIIIIIP